MEFLAAAFDNEELALIVPGPVELMDQFGIEAAVAFDIARPKLRQAMKVRLDYLIISSGVCCRVLTSCNLYSATRRS